MGVLCFENPTNPSKRCKLFCSVLRDALSLCHPCKQRNLSYHSAEEESPFSDFDDVQEEIISMIKERAMEGKLRRINPSFYKQEDNDNDQGTPEEFMSAHSNFSICSNCASADVDSASFLSVKTDFSQDCSSNMQEITEVGERKWRAWDGCFDSEELRRREIIQEILHCEGWPFGLCRKVLLLPPLPKSPSESWTWCKGSPKIIRTF